MDKANSLTDSGKRINAATAAEILGEISKTRMGSSEINSNGHRVVDGTIYIYQSSKSKNYVIDKKYGKLHAVSYVSRVLSQELAKFVSNDWYLISPSCIIGRIEEGIDEGLLDDLVLGGWAGHGKNSISFNQKIQNMEQVREYMLLKGFRSSESLDNVNPTRDYKDMVENNRLIKSKRRSRRKLSFLNKIGKWLHRLGK
jgi:hypothetical protein